MGAHCSPGSYFQQNFRCNFLVLTGTEGYHAGVDLAIKSLGGGVVYRSRPAWP